VTAPLLEVQGLVKHFPLRGGLGLGGRRLVRAVDGVSFTIGAEEAFGLVGETGSGKSTVSRLIARLIEPTAGEIRIDGEDWLALPPRALRTRRRTVQMVFQNPFSSLDPRWTVQRLIAEPLRAHRAVPRERAGGLRGLSDRNVGDRHCGGLAMTKAEMREAGIAAGIPGHVVDKMLGRGLVLRPSNPRVHPSSSASL